MEIGYVSIYISKSRHINDFFKIYNNIYRLFNSLKLLIVNFQFQDINCQKQQFLKFVADNLSIGGFVNSLISWIREEYLFIYIHAWWQFGLDPCKKVKPKIILV